MKRVIAKYEFTDHGSNLGFVDSPTNGLPFFVRDSDIKYHNGYMFYRSMKANGRTVILNIADADTGEGEIPSRFIHLWRDTELETFFKENLPMPKWERKKFGEKTKKTKVNFNKKKDTRKYKKVTDDDTEFISVGPEGDKHPIPVSYLKRK